MFGFKKRDPDIRALRQEGLKIVSDNHQLRHKNEDLQKEMAVLREEIRRLESIVREYQEMLFKKKGLRYRRDKDDDDDIPKKKGAPVGHEGTTRKTPDRVDDHKDVHLEKCPDCLSDKITPCQRYSDHYQEDIIIPQTFITRYRHHYYYCPDCKKTVHGIGDGELPGSYIGPNAKALAGFLHYQISIPYRKIKALFKEMFNMDFDPTSCVGFDKQMRIRGEPLYEKLKKSLKESPSLNVDETGWKNKWLWCYADRKHAVYKIELGRGQKELRGMLGDSYSGVLISDFLGAYNGIRSLRQRCLVHALRLIEKWRVYYEGDLKMDRYFKNLKTAVKRIIRLNKQLEKKTPKNFSLKKADAVGQLRRILSKKLEPVKAEKFRRKLLDRFDELVTCLNFKGVCAHNNHVERLLRGSVIMRKITFGNRSHEGELNHEVMMSLMQTARLQDINPLPFFRTLLTDPTKAIAGISLNLTSAG